MTGGRVQRLIVGPQRPEVCIGDAMTSAGIEPRSLAVISAGWQEAEDDIDDVRAAVGCPLVDLRLYARADALFRAEPGFHDAYRARQDRLRELQRLYALRLRQLALAARHTLRAGSDPDIAAGEQRHAIRQLRALDRHHLRATEKLHREFETAWQHDGQAAWRAQCEEVAALVEAHDGVLITGGNVIVLMNRMRLFGLEQLLADKTVVGWSAGAMVLASRIVLFHDRMPQGRREPEVLGAGCGLIEGTVVLPDSAHRLRIRERLRLGLMARRFTPQHCIVLDNGSCMRFDDGQLAWAESARRLTRGGNLVAVNAP